MWASIKNERVFDLEHISAEIDEKAHRFKQPKAIRSFLHAGALPARYIRIL